MWDAILYAMPLVLIVVGNIAYNMVGKAVPAQANPFASLCVTYAFSLVICVVIYAFAQPELSFVEQFKDANWTTYVLGITIVLIDVSVVYLYRVGWDLCVGTLIGNVGVSVLSVAAGVLLWGEVVSANMLAGVALCTSGLVVTSGSECKQALEGGKSAERSSARKLLVFAAPALAMLLARFLYMLVQKSAPAHVNALFVLVVTYASCTLYACIALLVQGRGSSLRSLFQHVNWTALAFGGCLVLMDFSTIWLFKAGWNLSIGSVLMYVLIAIALVLVGRVFYREQITPWRAAGVACCIVGIVLLMT